MMSQLITENLATWTTAPNGIKKLRELILELAVRGLLVPQDANDEPASVLLEKIAAEKARLVSEGIIKPPKPLPKISETEKPFVLPKGWEFEKIGNLAVIERGGSPRPIKSFLTDDVDGLNWIKIGDTDKGGKYIVSTSEKIIREGLSKTRMVYPGDFLLTNSMSFGRPYITKIEGCIHDGWLRISPSSTIDKDYLYLLLSSPYIINAFKSSAAGAVVQNLNADKVREVIVLIPPFNEQHRIVAKVDELMQLCDQLEQKQSHSQQTHRQLVSTLLTTLTEAHDAQAFQAAWSRIAANFGALFTSLSSVEQLQQTILQLAVMGKLVPQNSDDEPASALLKKIAEEKRRLQTEGKIKKQNPLPKISESEKPFVLPDSWEWERIGTVFNGGSGTTPLRSQKHYFTNGTENWFKTTDLNLSVVMEGEEKITKEAVKECNLTYYPKNTVCIAMYGGGGTIGKSGILGVSSTINQSVFALPPIESFNHSFLHLYVKSVRHLWMSFAAGLRKDPNINGLIIKKMLLPVPPLAEQYRIIAKVDELMTLCEQLKTKLQSAQTLQQQLAQTLVQQAVA